jgi:hypothetical protein
MKRWTHKHGGTGQMVLYRFIGSECVGVFEMSDCSVFKDDYFSLVFTVLGRAG